MTTQPNPEEIRRATFRVAFRGYDQTSVSVFLDSVAATVAELVEQRDRLTARLGEFADKDLRTEFEQVGREVASVLEAARDAAETMRERATADAARWRSEAIAEVESITKSARTDAEAMRTDAWTTSTQMLEQVQAESDRTLRAAERDALAIMGEAEREAHRLTSGAHREADELVRNAKMEAEKLVAQAQAEHDEIIETAHRQAAAAQERTRALEQRRDELMKEMESVRAALSSFEGDLEERRSGLGLSDPPELPHKAVVVDEKGSPHFEDWEEGNTVRVIRPTRGTEPEQSSVEEAPSVATPADADTLAAEVARLRSTPEDTDSPSGPEPGEATASGPVEPEPDTTELGPDVSIVVEPEIELEPESEPESAPESAAEAAPEPAPEPVGEVISDPEPESEPLSAESGPDEVFELFKRLRTPEPADADPGAPTLPLGEASPGEPPAEPVSEPEPVASSDDPFERRERLLLPVTNEALRSIKRILTDAQNEALEQIRVTEGEWVPDAEAFQAAFQADLEELVAEAAEAGREAATEMGMSVGGGSVEAAGIETTGADLAAALETGLRNVGDGSRERSAAASRVFRGWRTDEAERRVRALALSAYHQVIRAAIEKSGQQLMWVPAGRMCSACKSASETGDPVPPVHRDCDCTIVAA